MPGFRKRHAKTRVLQDSGGRSVLAWPGVYRKERRGLHRFRGRVGERLRYEVEARFGGHVVEGVVELFLGVLLDEARPVGIVVAEYGVCASRFHEREVVWAGGCDDRTSRLGRCKRTSTSAIVFTYNLAYWMASVPVAELPL